MKTTRLTIKNLATLFGVSSMTIYSWRKGTASKLPLPATWTPANIKRWAEQNSATMTCEPSTLVGVDIGRPGPKPRLVAANTARQVRAYSRASASHK